MHCVPDRLSAGLVQLPESGMGYQLVRVLSKGGGLRFVILNAEWAIAAGANWRPVEDGDMWPLAYNDHTRRPRARVDGPVDRMDAPVAIRGDQGGGTLPICVGGA